MSFPLGKLPPDILAELRLQLRLRAEPPMTRFLARQLSQSHCYKIDKARRDFGYRPTVSVENGLARLDAELRRLGCAT